MMRMCIIFSVLLLLAATGASAQEGQTKIKTATAPSTSPASGEQMYKAYCAVCHGADGKGNGPAVPALKVPVPDLTTLAQRHDGKYPGNYVESVLNFGTTTHAAHGSQDMPIWGPIFNAMGPGQVMSSKTTMRIDNLNRYIGTLQVK
jgi:mono/diheme cytochrome c family protein